MQKRKNVLGLLLALPLLSFPVSVHAADWLVNNLSLNYDNARGTATADAAQFTIEQQVYNFTNANFDVSWGAGQLVIERPLENFKYEIETDFLKDVTSAQVDGLSFQSIPGKVAFAVKSAALYKAKDTTALERTALNCQSTNAGPDPIDACIESGRFDSKGLTVGDTDVKTASLSIKTGRLNFSVDLKGIGKINGEGSATHDAANKVVALKITKVKLSILDVTGQFFSQLKDVKSDMIKVARPYVYISYGKKKDPAFN